MVHNYAIEREEGESPPEETTVKGAGDLTWSATLSCGGAVQLVLGIFFVVWSEIHGGSACVSQTTWLLAMGITLIVSGALSLLNGCLALIGGCCSCILGDVRSNGIVTLLNTLVKCAHILIGVVIFFFSAGWMIYGCLLFFKTAGPFRAPTSLSYPRSNAQHSSPPLYVGDDNPV